MAGPNGEKPIQIAGYHLRAEIARGGMGAVHRAYQISMDRVVAVKVLASKFTEDAVFVERFLKEARAAARLNHPNIVQAIDVSVSDGHYYFVMEFVEGSTLSALLRERGKIPPLEACGLIVQIARALEHASRFGMLHLDVKPGNIMVTPAGCAKLADFGLARHMEDEDTIYAQKKIIFGTPHYMSPEQIAGAVLDSRSDIYSLGVTFYETVTGQNPFVAPTTREVLLKVKSGAVSLPHEAEPTVSEDVSLVIQKMMSPDREQRYRDPAELLVDLDALSRLKPPPVVRDLPLPEETPPPAALGVRRRSNSMVMMIGIALVLGLAAAVLILAWFLAQRPEGAPSGAAAPQPPETARAAELFRAALGEAEGLMADGKFKEALQVYDDFAAKNDGTPPADEARRAAVGVRQRAGWYAESLARDARAAIERGDYRHAQLLADRISALHLPETDPTAQEVQANLSRAEAAARRHADETRQAAAERALAALQKELPDLIKEERFDSAAQRCRAFLSNPEYAQAGGIPRDEFERVFRLQRIQSAILAGAARSVGRSLQPRRPGLGMSGVPLNATLAGEGDRKILYRLGTMAQTLPLNLCDLAEADLLALAQAGLAAPLSKEDALLLHGGLAALFNAQGRHRAALLQLAEVREQQDQLPLWLAAPEEESLLGAAEEEFASGRLPAALDDLSALKHRHQRSRFYLSHIPQVGDLLEKIRARCYENMAAVPEGKFPYQNGRPKDLPLFYMDVREVTNAQYARFLDYCSETQDHSFDPRQQPAWKKDHLPLKWAELSKDRPNFPVVGVDWYDACAYAGWLGKRLPTDAEWEKAARGPDGLKYPWGNDWGKKGMMCNAAPLVAATAEDMPSGVVAVGAFPLGKSPYGMLDMAGNAREWISDEESPVSEPDAVTRGGSFADSAGVCATTVRMPLPRDTRDVMTGFRCARNAITDTP